MSSPCCPARAFAFPSPFPLPPSADERCNGPAPETTNNVFCFFFFSARGVAKIARGRENQRARPQTGGASGAAPWQGGARWIDEARDSGRCLHLCRRTSWMVCLHRGRRKVEVNSTQRNPGLDCMRKAEPRDEGRGGEGRASEATPRSPSAGVFCPPRYQDVPTCSVLGPGTEYFNVPYCGHLVWCLHCTNKQRIG